jgi:hypothetical protein
VTAGTFELAQQESCGPAIPLSFGLSSLVFTLTNLALATPLESTLTKVCVTVSNYGILTPVESTLTRSPLLSPLESALTKNIGGEGGLASPVTSHGSRVTAPPTAASPPTSVNWHP